MELRRGRHCVFMMHVHLIFIAKYRGKLFTDAHLKTMRDIMEKVCADFEAEIVEFNGEQDHVHLLVNYPPKVAISKLVNSLKGGSSRKLKQYYPNLHKPAYMKNALWSPSYFAGSVGGAPIDVLRQYIEQQDRPH
ncbi:IS200/IS605 family transposase [Shewanella xiamenensis]|uniref:IS200/IS605 family transposase n=1 Tax=Shewanella xiamenensis TaxID=332186 RepID=UPI00313DF831